MKLKTRILILVMLLTGVFFTMSSASANQGRVFEGCWTFFSAGQCRAVYRDSQRNYYLCGACDESGNPGSGSCSRISRQTLDQGYWCS